jgi:cell division protein FtsL
MGRLNFILLIAVLASGLMLVHSAYEARRLFTELDRAQAEARRLEADSQRLQAERHAQATNLRVEQVARERLRMRPITPGLSQGADDRAGAASGVQR